jgi:CRISPR-associated exonuclease Cas4
MITGVTIKHYLFCPAIVRIEELGFRERVTEAMQEGGEVDKEKVVNFLFPMLKAKEIIKKPIYKYKDLVGSPDFVLKFSYHYSPLDVKNTDRVGMDHKAQVLYYAYLMEKSGLVVKEGILYYTSGKLIRLPYTDNERRYVKRLIVKIREAREGRIKVIQPVRKCVNCGFFQYCKPKRVGKFYEV